jgi:hypothetical protein
MSPRKGRPEEKEGMYPSDPSQKDSESETAYQYTAAAVSPNAQHQGSEAHLYSIDYTDKPPPNPAQLLQELHHEELASQQPFFCMYCANMAQRPSSSFYVIGRV